MSDNHAVNLLWTGGWDSTFQLLRLLLLEKRCVNPYYLIEPERRSTGVELLTMRRIKARLFEEYPHTRELLQPLRYFAVADIAPDAEITSAYKSIFKKRHLGTQYEWLARFCKQHQITDMQLSIDMPSPISEDMVSAVEDGSPNAFRMDPKLSPADYYAVYRYYVFPTFNIRKVQTIALAKQRGWQEIMNMTWFCYKPARGKPCGKCAACLCTIKYGFGWRVPLRGRAASLVFRFVTRPAESLARKTFAHLGLLEPVRKLRKKTRPGC